MTACEFCQGSFIRRRRDQRFCSGACQQSAYNANRPKRPIVVPVYCCDICGSTPSRSLIIKRFSLRQSVKDGTRYTSRGVGTIFLCVRCWRTTAGQRRKQTGPRRIVEVAA